MRIQAALVEQPGGPFTIHDVEIQDPRQDEILVRVTAAGICHTDLTMRRGWRPERCPMVFGHEGAGVVAAVGDAITGFAPGDAVCLSYRSCGTCDLCVTGRPAYCLNSDLNTRGTRADGSSPLTRGSTTVFGNFFGQSSFATHALAYQTNTVRIPAGLPPALAAPLGCSVQTGAGTILNVLRPEPGSTVAVLGAGSVGLSAVMAAVSEGCTVIAVDPVESRRVLAEELGATATTELTARGIHYAIDTTGRADVIGQALSALRRRGTLALLGIGGRADFNVMATMVNGITIRGVIEGDATPSDFIPRLIDLHRSGRLPLEKLIAEYPFADIETAAQDALAGKVVKPILTFA